MVRRRHTGVDLGGRQLRRGAGATSRAVIEPAYVAMVRAGEASGKLEPVLRAIVEDRTRRELLADRINSAIRYPLFLVASAVAVLMFFLIYVVPQFEPVFKDLGGRLNAGAAFVLAASAWLRANLDLFLAMCAAFVLGAWLVASRRNGGQRSSLRSRRFPESAGTVRDRRTARVIGTLGLLVENGVALPAALKILRDVVADPRLCRGRGLASTSRCATADASAMLWRKPIFFRRWRCACSGSETRPAICPRSRAHAAQFYEHKLGIGLDRLMGAVGPATIILVSIVIGALIISIMSALLSITELAL